MLCAALASAVSRFWTVSKGSRESGACAVKKAERVQDGELSGDAAWGQMWRVRLCLAGGGREHIGYFSDENEGAMAYARALQRLKNELPAVRQEGGAGGAGVSGALGVGEEGAKRGAFSQVGGEQRPAGFPPPARPLEGAAAIGGARVPGGGFKAVPAQSPQS